MQVASLVCNCYITNLTQVMSNGNAGGKSGLQSLLYHSNILKVMSYSSSDSKSGLQLLYH